jgi:hypothetical protein
VLAGLAGRGHLLHGLPGRLGVGVLAAECLFPACEDLAQQLRGLDVPALVRDGQREHVLGGEGNRVPGAELPEVPAEDLPRRHQRSCPPAQPPASPSPGEPAVASRPARSRGRSIVTGMGVAGA